MTEEPNSEIQFLLALLSLPGVGRRTARKILGRLTDWAVSSPEELLDTLFAARETSIGLPLPGLQQAQWAWRKAAEVIERQAGLGIRIIGPSSGEFPSLLSGLDDPPLLLHVLGDPDCLRGRAMCAFVGTRKPSPFGRAWSREAGRQLGRVGIIVVSGPALGCDAAGHHGCLEAGGQAVAVLAHGLDFIYPAQNRSLAQRILDSGGALVSEYPVNTEPACWRFIERDRLQAGLSHGLILVESGLHGGSMHAVRHCLDLGRPLGCLRHTAKSWSQCQGEANRALIEAGKAVPLSDSRDLAEFVRLLKSASS